MIRLATKTKGDAVRQEELLDVGRLAERRGKLVHGTQVTGKTNWYTPPEFIAAARKVLKTIDLDPASCEFANQAIGATTFYDEEDDGLLQPWSGTVWLNPPYAAKVITAFVEKLLASLDRGDVSHAILLTHNNTDTRWFHLAMRQAAAFCFTRGRIRFYDENGKSNSPTHGHTFMYFSGHSRARLSAFGKAFGEFGTCVTLKGRLL